MSETNDHSERPDDDRLAAEYALGVLAAPERAEAERRIARDRSFALRVEAWNERLAPWAGEIGDVAAPPQLWNRIAAALPAPAKPRASLWPSLTFWIRMTLATGALAAACVAGVIYLDYVPQSTPLVAAIDGGGEHHFVATIDTHTGSIAVVPLAFSADATRVPELWLIPADGKPRALGLLAADRGVTIVIPAALMAHTVRDAVLAVSLEPPGGSPTGQPTGPVIATGKLTTL